MDKLSRTPDAGTVAVRTAAKPRLRRRSPRMPVIGVSEQQLLAGGAWVAQIPTQYGPQLVAVSDSFPGAKWVRADELEAVAADE